MWLDVNYNIIIIVDSVTGGGDGDEIYIVYSRCCSLFKIRIVQLYIHVFARTLGLIKGNDENLEMP